MFSGKIFESRTIKLVIFGRFGLVTQSNTEVFSSTTTCQRHSPITSNKKGDMSITTHRLYNLGFGYEADTILLLHHFT